MTDESLPIFLPPDVVEAIAQRAAEIVTHTMSERAAMNPRWLAGAQAAAEHLGVPRARIYKQLSTMPHHRHGSRLMFRTDELDRWLADQ